MDESGKACHLLGQSSEAISHYRNYLAHFGINLEILNLMGSCFYKMGSYQGIKLALGLPGIQLPNLNNS